MAGRGGHRRGPGLVGRRGLGRRARRALRRDLVGVLAGAGFVAAEAEAEVLWAAAGGDADRLAPLLDRRLAGEPLAWITGQVTFAGRRLRVDPGVYVPRAHSEVLARRAAARLPAAGTAVDLCTGSGAVAAVLAATRPAARVLATDLDPASVACARANGVDALLGDLFAPLPAALAGTLDVVAAVVPYVPTAELPYLQRDTFAFESALPYDGGAGGTAVLRRVATEAVGWLRPGGALLLELGGGQADELAGDLGRLGYGWRTLVDGEGDVRGIEATSAG